MQYKNIYLEVKLGGEWRDYFLFLSLGGIFLVHTQPKKHTKQQIEKYVVRNFCNCDKLLFLTRVFVCLCVCVCVKTKLCKMAINPPL